MFGLFKRRSSLCESGLLAGAIDNHSHILYGLDDGVKAWEESSAILTWMEELGLSEVWFTPHVMEDVPNTTEELKARYAELLSRYKGGLKTHLAAEYMLDNLFAKRLEKGDLLNHGGSLVLVETSTVAPPIGLWDILESMMCKGFRPLIAHPERYRYMSMSDYDRLSQMGCKLQLNLPSIVGFYGSSALERSKALLKKGMYSIVGSDCHRFKVLDRQYSAKELDKESIRLLRPLMTVVAEEI